MKQRYIELMERIFEAYTKEHLKEYTEDVFQNGIREHGYPRLTANLGILIAHGKKTELTADFKLMMDFCCENIPDAMEKWGDNGEVGNDFAVKEIVFCLLEIEKADVFAKEVTDNWRKNLAKLNPYTAYRVIAECPPKPINNWAAFNAASEQLRKYAGIGDETAFIDNQIKSQILSFDQNGMYRDPNEPMVYDMVTRLQLALSLCYGYEGEAREELESNLMKSAEITLDMSSVTGEIPYGGRSNQFLHNEAFYAALCEFYASVFARKGDLRLASKFKSAAHRAAESIVPWLENKTIHHVKNYYDIKSMYGCEMYAHFNKYMITTASWLYCAYALADDAVSDSCNCEDRNKYITETSEHFHKVFMRFNDYFVEIDTCADYHYDANGIGRIHKIGAPSAICLSVPFTDHPNYTLDINNSSSLSVCAGVKVGDEYLYSCSEKTEYIITEKIESGDNVHISYDCKLENGAVVSHTCTIDKNGVEISAKADGDMRILLPVFDFDGEKHTQLSQTVNSLTVRYSGWKCTYESDNSIVDTHEIFANRNGHYKCFALDGVNELTVRINISEA